MSSKEKKKVVDLSGRKKPAEFNDEEKIPSSKARNKYENILYGEYFKKGKEIEDPKGEKEVANLEMEKEVLNVNNRENPNEKRK